VAKNVNVALNDEDFDRKPDGVTWKLVIERGLCEFEADKVAAQAEAARDLDEVEERR